MSLISKSKRYIFKHFSLIFIITTFFILIEPAHAYAGPGVAIGALIVFLTVILTFFASLFLTIFGYLRKLFNYLYSFYSIKKQKKKMLKNLKMIILKLIAIINILFLSSFFN